MEITYGLNPNCIGKNGPESAYGWVQQTTSIDEFLKQTAEEGLAIMPGKLSNKYKCNENIQGFEILVVDVDNEQGETRWIDAINDSFLQQNAIAMWTSSNHQRVWQEGDDPKKQNSWKGQDRYRILFKLPEVLEIVDRRLDPKRHNESLKEVNQLLKRLQLMVPGSDQNCKAGTCLFGTEVASTIHVFSEINVLDVTQLVTLPEKVVHIHQSGEYKSFNGSTEDSLNNVKQFLSFISSDSESNWKDVGSALRNIEDSIGGEQVALDLYLEWSAKDYDPKPGESERMFLNWESNPELGGWGKLKTLAEEGGYQPHAIEALEPITFEPIEGFKVNSTEETLEPFIGKVADQLVVCDGKTTNDITYSETRTLMAKDVLPCVRSVALMRGDTWRFNITNHTIEKNGEPIADCELDTIHLQLSDDFGINFPKDTAAAFKRLAMNNPFDPYTEELDRVSKVTPISIDDLATRYFKATSPLADVMMKKWLVGLVKRLYEPGTYQRSTLVIKGAQDIGKDAFIGVIAGGEGRVVNMGHSTKLDDQNFMLACNGAWVVNLAEIESVTRNQVTGSLKAWLTKTSERFTRKFRESSMVLKRRFSTYGSCNETRFLQDPTGNTRYWVVESGIPSGQKINFEQLQSERDAILSMAIQLYREGFDTELDIEESKISEEHNTGFVEDAAYVEDLSHILDGRTCTYMTEVFEMLELGSSVKAQKQITNQVKMSLAQLGWNQMKNPVKINTRDSKRKSVKLWVRDEDSFNRDEVIKFMNSQLAFNKRYSCDEISNREVSTKSDF